MICSHCGANTNLDPTKQLLDGGPVDICATCGFDNLYIQKDFNRTLGITIVTVGVFISFIFFAQGNPFWAMLTLLTMAAIDGLIYMAMNEITVCYTCHTLYRGFGRNSSHRGFNLELLEKYGGRKSRR